MNISPLLIQLVVITNIDHHLFCTLRCHWSWFGFDCLLWVNLRCFLNRVLNHFRMTSISHYVTPICSIIFFLLYFKPKKARRFIRTYYTTALLQYRTCIEHTLSYLKKSLNFLYCIEARKCAVKKNRRNQQFREFYFRLSSAPYTTIHLTFPTCTINKFMSRIRIECLLLLVVVVNFEEFIYTK